MLTRLAQWQHAQHAHTTCTHAIQETGKLSRCCCTQAAATLPGMQGQKNKTWQDMRAADAHHGLLDTLTSQCVTSFQLQVTVSSLLADICVFVRPPFQAHQAHCPSIAQLLRFWSPDTYQRLSPGLSCTPNLFIFLPLHTLSPCRAAFKPCPLAPLPLCKYCKLCPWAPAPKEGRRQPAHSSYTESEPRGPPLVNTAKPPFCCPCSRPPGPLMPLPPAWPAPP